MNSYTLACLNQRFNTWCQVLNVEYGVNPAKLSKNGYHLYGIAAYWGEH